MVKKEGSKEPIAANAGRKEKGSLQSSGLDGLQEQQKVDEASEKRVG